MSAYTRWRAAEYGPVSERANTLLDEIDKIHREWLWKVGEPITEELAHYRAKRAEVEATLAEIDRLHSVMPAPSAADELGWALQDFVVWSPYFPVVVAIGVFTLLAVVLWLVIL